MTTSFSSFISEILKLLADKNWAVAKNKEGKTEIAHGYHDKRVKVKDNRALIMFYDTSKTNESWKAIPTPGEFLSNANEGYAFISKSSLSKLNQGLS